MNEKPEGYVFPAQWEPHKATWLSWPHADTYGEDVLKCEDIWVRLVEILQKHEEVHILVQDQDREDRAINKLDASGISTDNVFFHQILTDEFWIRDNGPFFVNKRQRGGTVQAVVNWKFNAWGGKYEKWENDDAVPSKIARLLGQKVYSPDMVLEGGSVDFNGLGTCLTTESVMLNPNRNPGLLKKENEQYIKDYLGVTNFIWLPSGDVAGNDTDGHVDIVARFANENTVVCAVEDDPKDVNYWMLKTSYERLQEARDQDGNPINIVTLPMPNPVYHEGRRLPASYENFYIANGVVLVETTGTNDSKEREALDKLSSLFPHRKVIGINCMEILKRGGGINCITQQQPKVQ